MVDLREKRKFKKLVYSKPVIVFMMIAFVFLVKPAWNAYSRYSESKKDAKLAEEKLEKLEERIEELNLKIESLNTERGLEEEVVDKFDVARVGEKVIVLVDGEEDFSGDSQVENSNIFSAFWRKIKSVF